MKEKSLTRFAWLSIGAALTTIALKSSAYFLTGSVGLLSDALESVVNLFAAIVALYMLKLAEKPPDEEHLYGHSKAEYFSSIVEGILIIIAALSIGIAAVERIIHPKMIEQAFFGLTISTVASLVNFVVATILLKAGKKNRSITLEADGHHLMTDVWTSVAVLVGITLVAVTKLQILDPVIAILVALNIVITGLKIMKRSALGLMDSAMQNSDLLIIKNILEKYCKDGISYHALRTRQSATRRFMSVHILVPGKWTVKSGHDLLEEIEAEIRGVTPKLTIFTHIEPAEDPRAKADISIDRS